MTSRKENLAAIAEAFATLSDEQIQATTTAVKEMRILTLVPVLGLFVEESNAAGLNRVMDVVARESIAFLLEDMAFGGSEPTHEN